MCIFAQLNIYLKISEMKKVWFLFLLLVLASCSPDPVTPSGGDNGGSSGSNSGGNGGSDNPGGDNPGDGGDEDNPSKPYFSIELPDTVKTLSSWATEFRYSTNIQDVSATSSEEWCKAEFDGYRLSILLDGLGQTAEQAAQNVYPRPRECTVTITAGEVYQKTFVVMQEPDDAQIAPGIYYPIEVSGAGDRVVKHIMSTCISWSAKTDADWLKANKIDESTLEIITSPRPDDIPTPRQATITLKSDLNYRVEATIQVKERESSLSAGEYEYGEPTTWD